MGSALVRSKPSAAQPHKQRLCHLLVCHKKFANKKCKGGVEIYLSQNGGIPAGNFCSFRTEDRILYEPLCDDFGPMDMLSMMKFIDIMDHEIIAALNEGCNKVVFSSACGRRALTNAAFLVGSYMLLRMEILPEDIYRSFDGLNFEGYRDATYSKPDFLVGLDDCLNALQRAKTLGWIAVPSTPESSFWGLFDQDAIAIDNDPLNGDMHEVVPRRFVAFRGPKDLGGRKYRDIPELGVREFSPDYYIDMFKDIGVSTVIRLNAPKYDAKAFTDAGIRHYDLPFDHGIVPSADTAARFFAIVDAVPDAAIAVHARGGFGRAGVLIAMALMRTHGFSAREAIAWLRIIRPGSIVGPQQHYLHAVEHALHSGVTRVTWDPPASAVADSRRQNVAVESRLEHSDDKAPAAAVHCCAAEPSGLSDCCDVHAAADAHETAAAAAIAMGGGGNLPVNCRESSSEDRSPSAGGKEKARRTWRPLPRAPARERSPPAILMVPLEGLGLHSGNDLNPYAAAGPVFARGVLCQ